MGPETVVVMKGGRIMIRSWLRGGLAAMVSVLLLAPVSGFAQASCAQDSDCAVGESCVRVPCAAVPCTPEGDCPVPECEPEGTCVGTSEWRPEECVQDSDCPDGFACETAVMPCGGFDCPPCACACPEGADCDCVCPPCSEPEPCDPVEVRYCVYAPKECGSDADCGAGFECQVVEACSVSGCACDRGCACPPCPEGEECPACPCEEDPAPCECPEDPEPECVTYGSFCVPAQIPCEDASDCPADFVCERWDAPVCACAACWCDPAEAECDCDPDCGCSEPTGETEGACLPRSWADAGIPAGAEPQPGEAAAEYARDKTDDPLDGGTGGNQDGNPAAPGEAAVAKASGCTAGTSGVAALLPFLLGILTVALLRRRPARL